MLKTDFNHGWTCRALSQNGEGVPVVLPHDAMRTEQRVAGSLGEANIGYYEGLDYEYRKIFAMKPEWIGKKLVLEFESVYHNAEVYVNGTLACARPYGYTNFYVDLTGLLSPSRNNEVRVIARNSDQPNSRWYSGTGIFRPVWLHIGPAENIRVNGVRIETVSTAPAVIRVSVKTEGGNGQAAVEVLDGRTIAAKKSCRGSVDIEIPDAKLWDTESPYLYTLRVTYGEDSALESFGIRSLTWNKKNGLSINGRRVVLRGACIHHENGILGACTYPEVEERRIRILKEAGYNAIRSAHNPCSKDLLDACDRLGMLVMDEYVDCWYMHKTQYDYASYVETWWQQDLKDMVEKDYNHPCVIMYSTGNEVAESAGERGIALQKDFCGYLHALDPGRPVTCGINIFFNFLSSAGFGVYSDEKAQAQAEAAKRAADHPNLRKPKKRAVGSEFYNLLAAKLGTDFMKWGASIPPCDWKTRGVFEQMDIAGYNYGIRRYRHDVGKYPKRLILGSETLVGDAYDFWEMAKAEPRIIGDFVWVGWDYSGECGTGAPEFADYRTECPEDRIRGGKCLIDLTGKKTPAVDYTRVAFELEKGPYLAVFPVYEEEKPAITGWQLTSAMRSWSWHGCEGRKTTVEIYARAARAELYVNGEKAGSVKLKKGRAKLNTVYHDGEIMAVAFDQEGREIGRDILRTAGKESLLRLEAETATCRPGEMVYFRIGYTDESGIWKPMEKHSVHVEAENGTVMGTANAGCYFRGNYAQDTVATYFGEAQTIVRAGEKGRLCVKASDGEQQVSCVIPVTE